jgi:hypothetical protein
MRPADLGGEAEFKLRTSVSTTSLSTGVTSTHRDHFSREAKK